MERQYRFAGVEIAVSMPEELFSENERRLAPFAVEYTGDPYRFRFELADALAPPVGDCLVRNAGMQAYSDGSCRVRYVGSVGQSWENAWLRTSLRGRTCDVQVKAGTAAGPIGTKAILNAIEAQHLIARAGGFVLHCAYIDRNGKAILFTAPSETGKSTQAELWRCLRGAEIINGDRAAVRVTDGGIFAEGIPFAGSSAYCLNRSLPVAAVVYLGQAPVTGIRRMRGYEAFARVWEGCSVNTWDREDVSLVSNAVKALAETVPVYHLTCTPDESAVTALENALESR